MIHLRTARGRSPLLNRGRLAVCASTSADFDGLIAQGEHQSLESRVHAKLCARSQRPGTRHATALRMQPGVCARCRCSSHRAARASSSGTLTSTAFVDEQRSRPALLLVVRSRASARRGGAAASTWRRQGCQSYGLVRGSSVAACRVATWSRHGWMLWRTATRHCTALDLAVAQADDVVGIRAWAFAVSGDWRAPSWGAEAERRVSGSAC